MYSRKWFRIHAKWIEFGKNIINDLSYVSTLENKFSFSNDHSVTQQLPHIIHD